MSERIVTDPSQHGWIEVDGKWVWDGGSTTGHIADGDTEGQITTWDGTEWTPEGAVVVSGGNVGIGTDNPQKPLHVNNDGTWASVYLTGAGGNALELKSYGDANNGSIIDAAGDNPLRVFTGGTETMRIDADGNVNITGKLFINGQEVTGGGGDSFWVEESPGVIKYTGTAKATDVVAG